MKENAIKTFTTLLPLSLFISIHAQAAQATQHKRFSVSAGWLHVMPQGSANPININTAVKANQKYAVGEITPTSFLTALKSSATREYMAPYFELLPGYTQTDAQNYGLQDRNGLINATTSGGVTLQGLDHWREQAAGLEAEKVDTLGLTLNYYLSDHVSLQLVGGIPPKVDIKGKGKITAKSQGVAESQNNIVTTFFGKSIPIQQDMLITDLSKPEVISTARAWTPTLIAQYQFGRTGVNKFRPYLGVGLMYAYFNEIKLNPGTTRDLVNAGHMVQNIIEGKAGAAMDKKQSSASPQVKVKADNTVAPVLNLGFTYDLNDRWYTVASVSYAKLNNQVNINVINAKNNQELIRSSSKIDIDPIITYLGLGYRF